MFLAGTVVPFIDSPTPARHYDFVIVGAGSAGAHLANRLSCETDARILVIEAGSQHLGAKSTVPAYYPRLFGSSIDWGYHTTPQTHLAGRRLVFPRGKAIGGCGAINALIHVTPAIADFARWGWPTPPPIDAPPKGGLDATVCSVTGLPLSVVPSPHPWTGAFLEAVQAVGFSLRTPLHQSSVDTAGLFALTQHHGRRRHIGNQLGALRAAETDVLTGWQAQRLLLEPKASLVVSDRSGNQVTLASPGKIILSAGAVGSPTLLLRSGIGAPDSVAHNTRATLDLPAVGENLQDHLVYPVVYRAKQASGLPRRFGPEHRKAFRDHGSGPMASNIAEAGAFFSLDASADAPQFQLHFTPTHYLKYPLDGETDCCSIAVTPLHPKSRGRVSVHSEVNPNYLAAESDRAALSDAVDWTRKQVGPRLDHLLDREIMPGRRADRAGGLSKSCAAFAQSIYHPTSTCRMGKTPTDSVVNAQFELHGCADILIADASVLPDLPSGNTQAATFWAAERCAQSLIESSK